MRPTCVGFRRHAARRLYNCSTCDMLEGLDCRRRLGVAAGLSVRLIVRAPVEEPALPERSLLASRSSCRLTHPDDQLISRVPKGRDVRRRRVSDCARGFRHDQVGNLVASLVLIARSPKPLRQDARPSRVGQFWAKRRQLLRPGRRGWHLTRTGLLLAELSAVHCRRSGSIREGGRSVSSSPSES